MLEKILDSYSDPLQIMGIIRPKQPVPKRYDQSKIPLLPTMVLKMKLPPRKEMRDQPIDHRVVIEYGIAKENFIDVVGRQ